MVPATGMDLSRTDSQPAPPVPPVRISPRSFIKSPGQDICQATTKAHLKER